MSLRNEARPSVTTPATNLELSTDDRDRSGKLRRIALTAGRGATALLATGTLIFGATACGTNEKPAPRAEAATSAPATPGASETQNPSEVVENGDGSTTGTAEKSLPAPDPSLYEGRTNPETLVNLTHEQLVQAIQITKEEAPTPDKFAQLVLQRMETWANAGATPEEVKPYLGSKSGYMEAMTQKYDEAFDEGLFGEYKNIESQGGILSNDHYIFLQRYLGMAIDGDPNQTVHFDYKGSSVVESYTDGSYIVDIHAVFSDTYGQGDTGQYADTLKPYHHEGTMRVLMKDENGDGSYDLKIISSDVIGNLNQN